ncbi:hypothetical protein MNBD_GAMMA13-307 [hydrothermal vent metagenome]|uniref:Schlafen AlbA-2 domain-containing protein n=1 Tax=hydrothermal vent metagenome TaxID=652676 RepID=A0A3B0Y0C4_9ZZZZ
MINRELNITDPIKRVAEILESNAKGYCGLRRRAVLSHSNDGWVLVACTVEGIISSGNETQSSAVRQYSQAMLFEDWLTDQDCRDFINQIEQGRLCFGELILETTESNRHWSGEQVPLSNYHMDCAGYVLSTRFSADRAARFGALLAPEQPYYPDLDEAVRDWLPFPVYHGDSDSRNGDIVFLLPETRAFLSDAIPNGNRIGVRVAGTDAGQLSLMLKGAWWEDGLIHHLDVPINKQHAELNIPSNASRLEYALIDAKGTVYDFQRENEYQHAGLGRKRLRNVDAPLVAIVHEACLTGEGMKVEFKPFVELDIGKNNTKLSEIIRTVVAFANSVGGRIFLGIDDNCALIGIDTKLAQWAKASADEAACNSYLGTLRGKIRDMVVGDTTIHFLQALVDNQRVVIIEVSEAKERPISIRQDNYLYIRRGASNVRATPGEWRNIICPQGINGF